MTTAEEEDYVETIEPFVISAVGVNVTPTLDTAAVVGAFASPQYGWFSYTDDTGKNYGTDIQQAKFDPASGFYLVNWTLYAVGKAVAVNYTGTLFEMGATPSSFTTTWTQPLLAGLDQVTFRWPSSMTTLAAIKEILSKASMSGWMNGTQYADLRTMITRLNRTRIIQ